MPSQQSTWFIPLFAGIALASACGSDDGGGPNGAAGAATGGASAGGATTHSGGGGQAGGAGRAGNTAGSSGTLGAAGHDALAGAAGDDARGGAGAGGDSATPGEGGSAGTGGEAGIAGAPSDPNDTLQRYAYVATFLNGLIPVSIEPATGKLSKLGSTVNAGAQLYAVSVDPTQRFVFTAEQGTKKINTYAIAPDGSLPSQPNSSTTIDGRPTSLTLAAQGRFAYVASSDEDQAIYAFAIDAGSGALSAAGEPLKLAAASPAYVAAEPTGHFLYVTQNGAFGIRGYLIDQASGALSELATSPYGVTQVSAGAIAFHPGGAFLFTSGAGLNAFAIDSASGALTLVEGSPFSTAVSSDPSASNLAVEPRGKYLYATSFLNPPRVFGFEIDSSSGKLTAVPGEPIKGGSPYSVAVEPSGRFVFAGNDDGTTSAFSLQRSDGTLHEIDGSPFQLGGLQPEFAFATAR